MLCELLAIAAMAGCGKNAATLLQTSSGSHRASSGVAASSKTSYSTSQPYLMKTLTPSTGFPCPQVNGETQR